MRTQQFVSSDFLHLWICLQFSNGHTSSCSSSLLMRLSLGRGAGVRPTAARHSGRAQTATTAPSAPLLLLARTGAVRQHVAVPPVWDGALELSDTDLVEGVESSSGAHAAPAAHQTSCLRSVTMIESSHTRNPNSASPAPRQRRNSPILVYV